MDFEIRNVASMRLKEGHIKILSKASYECFVNGYGTMNNVVIPRYKDDTL